MRWPEWTRRDFLKTMGSWAGAGILQPTISLIGAGKSIAAAYPDEVLSIEKFTKGRVKPGMVISKDNADLVKDIAPEGLYVELTRGREIKITETTLRPEIFVPQYWIDATLRNSGKATLDKDNMLWTTDGKPWIGGDPFPQAKTAYEHMWNHLAGFRKEDDVLEGSILKHIDANGTVVRTSEVIFVRVSTTGRVVTDPKPYLPANQDELFRIMLVVLKPFDAYGLSFVTTVPYDQKKLPRTEAYIPTLRRVRNVPTTQRFEPGFPYATFYPSDNDTHADPLLTWSWKLAGRKPMLQPAPVNLGSFAKGATKDDFVFPFVDQKYPRMSWELRPEVYVVEGVPHLPGAPYSKKLIYIDAIAGRGPVADIYDLQGKIWKWIVFSYTTFEVNGKKITNESMLFFADLQKDYRDNIYPQAVLGGEKMRVNSGLRLEDWATAPALMRLARR
jgi:hypothetical protein